MDRRSFLESAGVIFIQFFPAAVDECTVIALFHFDTALDTNEAPYFAYVDTTYSQSSDAAYGAYAIQPNDYAGENSVYLNGSFDELNLPVNGKATFEWRMKRVGGVQNQGLGADERGYVYAELRLTGGESIYVDFGFFGSSWSKPGAGFSALTGDGSVNEPRATTFGWTDSNYHAVRISVDCPAGFAYLHIDGVYQASVAVGALTGTNLRYLAWQAFQTFPLTTDTLRVDEMRVILGRALSGATDYTSIDGPWDDATCDSGATPAPTTVFIDFEDAPTGPITTFYDSAYGVVFTSPSGVFLSDPFDLPEPSPYGDQVLWATGTGSVTIEMDVTGGFVSPLTMWRAASTTLNFEIRDSGGTLLSSGGMGSAAGLVSLSFSGLAAKFILTGTAETFVIDGIGFATS